MRAGNILTKSIADFDGVASSSACVSCLRPRFNFATTQPGVIMKTNRLHNNPLLALALSLVCTAFSGARAGQIDITGPAGSGKFGTQVTVLPNGTFVAPDPGYDPRGRIADVGAAYLHDG